VCDFKNDCVDDKLDMPEKLKSLMINEIGNFIIRNESMIMSFYSNVVNYKDVLITLIKSREKYYSSLGVSDDFQKRAYEFYKDLLYNFIIVLEQRGISIKNNEEIFVDNLISSLNDGINRKRSKLLEKYKLNNDWNNLTKAENDTATYILGWVKLGWENRPIYAIAKDYCIFFFSEVGSLTKFNQYNEDMDFEFTSSGVEICLSCTYKLDIKFECIGQIQDFQNHIATITHRKFEENQYREERESQLNNLVIQTVNDLIHRDDVKEICGNFLNRYWETVFLNKESIFRYERNIYNMLGKKGDFVLLANVDDFREGASFFITSGLGENFDMLTKTLSEKYSFQSIEIRILSCWKLLYKLNIDFFASKWQKDFGKLFFNIIELDLQECLKIYSSIDFIDSAALLKEDTLGKFVYFLIKYQKFGGIISGSMNYLLCLDYVKLNLFNLFEQRKYAIFDKSLEFSNENPLYTINDIDLMNGHEFEKFISILFSKMGYTSAVTKGSQDQGIDVVVNKNNNNIGIQCKRYAKDVKNSAIQEVVAGVKHYHLNKAMVITNRYFTKSAIELAKTNDVILWDRDILKEKIIENFG